VSEASGMCHPHLPSLLMSLSDTSLADIVLGGGGGGGGKGGREGGRELDVSCFDVLCVVFFVMCDVGLLVRTLSTLNKQVCPKILTEVPRLRRWRADTVRHPVLYVPSQCLFTSVVLCFCDV
jgi:hypothetical protein